MRRIYKLAVAAFMLAWILPTGTSLAGEGFRGFSIGIIGNDTTFETQGRENEGYKDGSNDNVGCDGCACDAGCCDSGVCAVEDCACACKK